MNRYAGYYVGLIAEGGIWVTLDATEGTGFVVPPVEHSEERYTFSSLRAKFGEPIIRIARNEWDADVILLLFTELDQCYIQPLVEEAPGAWKSLAVIEGLQEEDDPQSN